jgi:hypothetical protein
MLHYSDYLREQAEPYRALAANSTDLGIKQDFLELAEICEEGRQQDRRSARERLTLEKGSLAEFTATDARHPTAILELCRLW